MFKTDFPRFGFNTGDLLKKFHDRRASRSSRSTTISDDIVDVDFEDISKDEQSTKKDKKRTFDKDARAKEIVEAGEKLIMEKVKDASSAKQMSALCALVTFSMGADWADEHHKSSFSSDRDRWNAVEGAIDEMTKDAPSLGINGKLLFNMSFIFGVKWADENPPKYGN